MELYKQMEYFFPSELLSARPPQSKLIPGDTGIMRTVKQNLWLKVMDG